METLIREQQGEIERLRAQLHSKPQPLPHPHVVGEEGDGSPCKGAESELDTAGSRSVVKTSKPRRHSGTHVARSPLSKIDLGACRHLSSGEVDQMHAAIAAGQWDWFGQGRTSDTTGADDEASSWADLLEAEAEEEAEEEAGTWTETTATDGVGQRGEGARRKSQWAAASAARKESRMLLEENGAGSSQESTSSVARLAVRADGGGARPEKTALVGATVAVWLGGGWVRARVHSYAKKSGKHKLKYEGETALRLHAMRYETWELLVERAPAAFDPTASVLRLPGRAQNEKLTRSPKDGRASPAATSKGRKGVASDENASENAMGKKGAKGKSARGGASALARLQAVDDASSDHDFTPRSQSALALKRAQSQSTARKPAPGAPRIAFSGLLPADVTMLESIAATLGGALVHDDEAHTATHLVLGERGTKGAPGAPKRTLKVLQAILRGAWLLSDTWLLHSLEAGELLPEAPFETPAFRGARAAREKREQGVAIEPLKGRTLAIVESDSEAYERLRLLATAAGATVTSQTRAEVWVGQPARAPSARSRGGAKLVAAEWLYDSVSMCEAMPVA